MYDEDLYYEDYDYNSGFTIEDTRKQLGEIVEYFKNEDYYKQSIEVAFVKERQLPWSVAIEHDIFFVNDGLAAGVLPEWMQHDSLGLVKFNRVVYAGRLVYPVKDVLGQVMGFCGWDKFEKPKYLDSKNHGYKAKQTTLYGMEKIEEYYKSNKPVFITEGIVCCLYLRSKGYQALALLGSYMTPYIIQILLRFGSRLVVVPDCDEAGDSFVRQCKWNLKKAIIVQVKYGKDIDGCRKLEDHKYENLLLKDIANLSNPFYRTEIFIRR